MITRKLFFRKKFVVSKNVNQNQFDTAYRVIAQHVRVTDRQVPIAQSTI